MQFLLHKLIITLRIVVLDMQHVLIVFEVGILMLIRILILQHLIIFQALRDDVQFHAPAAWALAITVDDSAIIIRLRTGTTLGMKIKSVPGSTELRILLRLHIIRILSSATFA